MTLLPNICFIIWWFCCKITRVNYFREVNRDLMLSLSLLSYCSHISLMTGKAANHLVKGDHIQCNLNPFSDSTPPQYLLQRNDCLFVNKVVGILWMLVSPKNSKVEILMPNVMVLEWKVFRRWSGHEHLKGRGLMNGISTLTKETSQRRCPCVPEKGPPDRRQPCWCLNLGLLSL